MVRVGVVVVKQSNQLVFIVRQQKVLAFYNLVNLLDCRLRAVFPCVVKFLLHWESIRLGAKRHDSTNPYPT